MSGSDAIVRLTAHTSAGADAVWRCVADPYAYRRWVSGTTRIRRADPQWPASGARLYHRFGHWPLRSRDHTTVLECEPTRRIVLAAAARPWALVRVEVAIAAEGGGTRITLCERVVGGLGARWPRLTRAVQWARNRRSLRLLVELAERDDR